MPPGVEHIINGSVDLVFRGFDQGTLAVPKAVDEHGLSAGEDHGITFCSVYMYRADYSFDRTWEKDVLTDPEGLKDPGEGGTIVLKLRTQSFDLIIPVKSLSAACGGG